MIVLSETTERNTLYKGAKTTIFNTCSPEHQNVFIGIVQNSTQL